MRSAIIIGCTTIVALLGSSQTAAQSKDEKAIILVDDFESYEVGGLPLRWKYNHKGKLVPLEARFMHPDEEFYVVEEDGNQVLRVYTDGEAAHLMMANEPDGFDWDIESHPILAWDWRALRLPKGAREDEERLNDSGVALYVFFKFEGLIIKRPKAIKYVYSSSLPVDTVVSYGKLKVVVVSSGLDGYGDWEHVERNVLQDYKRIYGEDPPRRPLSLRLWSDSDNTDEIAEAEYDNIKFLPLR